MTNKELTQTLLDYNRSDYGDLIDKAADALKRGVAMRIANLEQRAIKAEMKVKKLQDAANRFAKAVYKIEENL